jgi:transcriptional regulator with PAS, ATPase and Fis domain
VAINCGALPESLAESELFGHTRGAFTGAAQDKPGLFLLGDGGTIFLDEVCSMPLAIQAKLLRAIEEKRIMPVGSTELIEVNARILCATNRDLLPEVEAKRFREDLYYRLNVVEVHIPPLRERREDIPALVRHFIEKYNRELNKNCPGVSDRAMEAMMAYFWRGNVRELANVIERALIFSDGRLIDEADLAFVPRQAEGPQLRQSDLKSALRNYERQYILKVLRDKEFDKHAAARALRVGLSSLYRKMNLLGISAQDGRYELEESPPTGGERQTPGSRDRAARADQT